MGERRITRHILCVCVILKNGALSPSPSVLYIIRETPKANANLNFLCANCKGYFPFVSKYCLDVDKSILIFLLMGIPLTVY